MNKQEILNALKELKDQIHNSIVEEKMDNIVQILIEWYNNPIESKYKDFEDNLYNAIIELLGEVYRLTSSEIKKIYNIPENIKLPISKIITYDKDGKTLRERIRKWFCPKAIREENDLLYWIIEEDNPNYIFNKLIATKKLIQIMETETRNQEQKVIYDKLKNFCDFVVLEESSNCHDGICNQYAGEWPIDEFDFPPYHPNCECEPFYEVTDIWDEIEELDLEDEV